MPSPFRSRSSLSSGYAVRHSRTKMVSRWRLAGFLTGAGLAAVKVAGIGLATAGVEFGELHPVAEPTDNRAQRAAPYQPGATSRVSKPNESEGLKARSITGRADWDGPSALVWCC